MENFEEELTGLLQEAAQRFQLKEDVQRWSALSTVAGDLISMAYDRFNKEDKPNLEAYVLGLLDGLARMQAINEGEFHALEYAVWGVLGISMKRARVTANVNEVQ